MQQWQKLLAQGIEIPQPQQQILDDLQAFAKPNKRDGHEVIIMMDANSPIDDSTIKTFMEELNLYDLMADYLPATPPNTYQRG
jgi:L-alanine-DL-glutamate epimerase-like enolase superfamily enzyme